MNSTNNPFLWDKQCPSFLGPINAVHRETPIISRKSNSFYDISPNESRTSSLARCDMCFQNPVQTYTCSNCPKNSCSSCIQQRATGHNLQCPHCLHPLKNSSSSDQENAAVCQDHKAPVSYYCLTCKVAACADCAMFEEKHKNHKFEKLEKAYEEKMGQITGEMGFLGQRLDKLRGLLVTLDSNIGEVTKNKEMRATELSIVTEQMAQRLGTELKSKLAVFIAQKGMINGEIDFLQRTQHTINQQLGNWPKGLLLVKGDETLKNLQEINAKASQDDEYNKVPLGFVSEITPQFETGYFSIKPFSILRQTTEVIYSEPLYCYGLKWRLKVYPNGSGIAKGEYLSVFLEMMEGLKKPARYEYQVEMLNQRNPESTPVSRDFVSEFEAGECWGYNRFFKISGLEEEGYLIPEKDTILLKFSVRAQTYYQQCHDQRRYIKYLEESRSQDQLLIAELRNKLEMETREKQRLLEEQTKSATLAQDLLDVGDVKTATPKKEIPKENPITSIGSLEAIENGTPFDDLISKIRGQKEPSNKAESQRADKEAFYNLLERTIQEEFAEEHNVKEEIKEKVNVENSQNDTKPKEGADICAQFEMLECSFDDVSSCSVEEASEDDGENVEDIDVEHVVLEQTNEGEKDMKGQKIERSNKTQNSSPGGFEQHVEELQYESYEASSNNLSNGSGCEKRGASSGRESLGKPDGTSRSNDLLVQFSKERDSLGSRYQKRGAAGEPGGSPSFKKRTIFEDREEKEKKLLSKFANDPLN